MSGAAQELRRALADTRDLQGVVGAMKALAAANIGQYQQAVVALQGYYRTVELGLVATLAGFGPRPSQPTAAAPAPGVRGAVIFGSDEGLVGRFNETVVEHAARVLGAPGAAPPRIWAVGERIHALLGDAGLTPSGLFAVPATVAGITHLVGRLLIAIETAQHRDGLQVVELFHNQPQAGAAYAPTTTRLLPLDHRWQARLATLPWPTRVLPEAIDGSAAVLPPLIRGYLFTLLFQACAESLASENASRLAAMQRAEKNIAGVLAGLETAYQRVRQEAIDEELFDVIAGCEALAHVPRASGGAPRP